LALGKRLHNDFYSLSGVLYSLEIHDADYVGASVAFKTANNSIRVKYKGVERNRINPVIPASISFSLIVENATIETLINDLVTSNESRFTCVLIQSGVVKFAGFLVVDLVRIENISYPYFFTINAVDGIARLKDLEYDNAGTAYTGKETLNGHLNNVISQIGLSTHTGTALTKLTEWREDNHQPGADLLENTRLSHLLFTKKDKNGNNKFSNPFFVLKEISKTFLGRFLFWDDSYHFQQINAYDTTSAYDINVNKVLSGGGWTFLPPLRQSKVLLKYGDTSNTALGVGLTQDNNTGYLDSDFKTGESYVFKGLLEYKTTFSAAFIAANGIKTHRVKFGIVIGVGSDYLERTAGTSDFYNIENGAPEWVTDDFNNLRYYEFYGDVITEFNYNWNKTISFNIVTPPYAGADVTSARLQIHDIHFLKPDGGYYTDPDISLNWSLYNAVFQEETNETTVINYEKIYTASNSIAGNSKNLATNIIMGDIDITTNPAKLEVFDGANWLDSSAWSNGIFTGKNIGQILTNEIIAGQTKPIRILEQTIIEPNFSLIGRYVYDSVNYIFLSGSWAPELDEVSGQFLEINIDRANVTEGDIVTGDGSTSTDPTNPDSGGDTGTDPTDPNNDNTNNDITNIQYSLLDCLSIIRLDQDLDSGTLYTSFTIEPVPAQIIFYENDILKIIHPVTGYSESISVAANTGAADESKYTFGDTTLYATYTPAKNFPDGSFILKDLKNSPKQEIQYNTFEGVTAGFVDVDFNLPDTTDEINKRVLIFREFAVSQNSKDFTIGPDGGGLNRRVTFTPPLDNENVLIKLLPEI